MKICTVAASLLFLGLGGCAHQGASRVMVDPVDAYALRLYVSPAGNDGATGRAADVNSGAASANGPYATIARARDEIRKLKTQGALPAGGVAVEILGGTYSLDKSIEFTADDSGSAVAPVIYRAYRNQPVQLVGGRVVKASDFSPVTDPAILARLDPIARDKVLCLSADALGLKHAGPFPPVFGDSGGIFEVIFNGQRMPLSRWPNTGYVQMKKALVNGDAKTGGTFEYREDRPTRWLANPNIWLKGKWRVGWEDPAIRVASIDTAKHTIRFAAGIAAGIGNKYTRPYGNGKEPYCAINLLEEIDQPGEWALDFSSHMLYFWPPESLKKSQVLISQLDTPMIALKDAAHLSFVGLTFESSLGDGLVMQNAESDLVAGCTFRNLAKRGVVVNGYRSGVQSSDIHHVGEGCIYLTGGDRKTLTPSNNFAVNNHLHHYAVLKSQYSAAIDVGYGGQPAVGIRAANNLIHDAPRDAFIFSGNDHVFELNEIYNCGFDTADTGVFYSWLDWTIRGVKIQYNFMHDTLGGVNPDDAASGNFVFGNIFVGPRTGVWIASGPDHTIQNNIFVKDQGPIFGMDDRGASRGYAVNPRMIGRVKEINPTQAPWATRYPQIVNMLENHPELPWRTRVTQNVVVIKKGEPYSIKMNAQNKQNKELFTWENNYVTNQDPGFVDVAKGNFALKPNSIVFKKIPGFQPIPFDKIGLYKDQYRRTLPDPKDIGKDKPIDPFKAAAERNFGT